MLNTFITSSTFLGGLFQEAFLSMSSIGKHALWDIVPLVIEPRRKNGDVEREGEIADRIDELVATLSDNDVRAFAKICDGLTVCWPEDVDLARPEPGYLSGPNGQSDAKAWG